ncbi:HTH-type transcriptional repressor DasR [Spirochaetia bacterium]|nr:HTH-type transcriptional repressor DasR [Spirochaetia bacterium]
MTLDYSAYVPHYVHIKDYLLTIIRESEPNSLVPGETSLAERFKVSRGTAKQAILDLVGEGLLYRVQGKGTFVAPMRIPRSFDRLPTFTEDIRNMGFQSHSKVLWLGKLEPEEKIRGFFRLPHGAEIICFRRLVELDGEPVVAVSSYLSPDLYPELESGDIHESLYSTLLEKYGKVPVKARDTYSIVRASGEMAKFLKVPDSGAVFYSERFSYLDDMTPAEYVESFIRGDRFKLNISIGIGEDVNTGDTDQEDNCGTTHYGIGFRNIIT